MVKGDGIVWKEASDGMLVLLMAGTLVCGGEHLPKTKKIMENGVMINFLAVFISSLWSGIGDSLKVFAWLLISVWMINNVLIDRCHAVQELRSRFVLIAR